jgi:hypothetical protein
MFHVSDLNKKYHYDFSITPFSGIVRSENLNKKDPFQVIAFIKKIIISKGRPCDTVTYDNCKQIEFLIQEKLPQAITKKKEVYRWLVNNWRKFYFPSSSNVSRN